MSILKSKHLAYIIYAVAVISPIISKGQDSSKTQRKNIVHIEASTCLLLGQAGIRYERQFWQKGIYTAGIGTGFGGGYYTDLVENGCSGYVLPISYNSSIGRLKHFLEIDAGMMYLINFTDKYNSKTDAKYFPIFIIGYKRISANGGLFRAFIGTTGIGIGLGQNF